jgi:hypothetical protein
MNNRKNRFPYKNARILFLIPGILLLCFFAKCNTKKQHQVDTAFYYWKTNFHLNTNERRALDETKTTAIYLRLFDVDWNLNQRKALPVGIVQSDSIDVNAYEFIPVLYITQSCLRRLQDKDIPELSSNISLLVSSLCVRYHINPKEIQIDCDWTKNTADLYFSLLRQLKSTPYFHSRLLSCTIRLHQVKYVSASGVPPVDKGMLMVYNMGNLTRYGGQNSILDVALAKDYLKHIGQYKLHLDIALPIYYWSVLFNHSQFKGITYNISKSQFADSLMEQKEGNLYRILSDVEVGGYAFKKNEEIRFEEPLQKDLVAISSFVASRIKDTIFRVTFFHLDESSMKHFSSKDLNEIHNILK